MTDAATLGIAATIALASGWWSSAPGPAHAPLVAIASTAGSTTVAVYLAVYNGNGGEVRALRCTPQVASGVDAGEMVRATISPHLGHVYSVERAPG